MENGIYFFAQKKILQPFLILKFVVDMIGQ